MIIFFSVQSNEKKNKHENEKVEGNFKTMKDNEVLITTKPI